MLHEQLRLEIVTGDTQFFGEFAFFGEFLMSIFLCGKSTVLGGYWCFMGLWEYFNVCSGKERGSAVKGF